MVLGDYHRGFCKEFGREDVTATHLNAFRKRNGWKVGRAGERYAGRSRLFSREEIEWLHSNCTMTAADQHHVFCTVFSRHDISAAQLVAFRKRKRWKTGRTGRFEKGIVPANKGKKMPFNANTASAWFTKGHLPANYRGAGHERVDSKDGYVILIVAEPNPWTGAKTRPVLKHRWLWEKKNGPLPKGMVLKSLDGDKLNTDPSNWVPVQRALMPRLNGGPHKSWIAYDDAPDDLKPTIMATAKLDNRLRSKGARHG